MLLCGMALIAGHGKAKPPKEPRARRHLHFENASDNTVAGQSSAASVLHQHSPALAVHTKADESVEQARQAFDLTKDSIWSQSAMYAQHTLHGSGSR